MCMFLSRKLFIIMTLIKTVPQHLYTHNPYNSYMKYRHVRLVREAGTSLAVTIPADFKIFEAGDEVWVELRGSEIVISKVAP